MFFDYSKMNRFAYSDSSLIFLVRTLGMTKKKGGETEGINKGLEASSADDSGSSSDPVSDPEEVCVETPPPSYHSASISGSSVRLLDFA